VLLLLIAAGVFLWFGMNTDWVSTWKSVKNANPFWLGAGAFIMVFAHWIRAYRWNMLTEPAGHPLNVRRSFYAVLTGYMVNVATSRGGEVVRCALSAKSEKAPLELLVGTVVTERIIDMLMLLLVCVAGLIVEFEQIYGFFEKYILNPVSAKVTPLNLTLAGLGILLLVLVFTWMRKRKRKQTDQKKSGIKAIFERFAEGLQSVFKLKNPSVFALLSMSIWFCYLLGGFCMLQSLDITSHMGFGSAISLLIFSAVGIAIPLPAGAGVWGTMAFGLQMVYNMEAKNAETFGIFSVAFQNLYCIFYGSVAYLLLWIEMQKKDAADSTVN